MLGDPQQLRRGEARHGDIAGAAAEIGNAALEFGAFGEGAAVVPQNRRTQDAVGAVEQNRAMHLAGEADAGEARERLRRFAPHRRDRVLDAFAQSAGFCSLHSGCGRDSVERGRSLRREALIAVDQNGLDRRRADVEPEKHVSRLTLCLTSLRSPRCASRSSAS